MAVYVCKHCRRRFRSESVPDHTLPMLIDMNGQGNLESVCPECAHPAYLTDEDRASYLPDPIGLPEGDGTGIKLERGVQVDLRGRKR